MRGKEKLLQGMKDLGKQLRNKKTAFVGAIRSSSRTLTKKTTGVKSSFKKLAKRARRISG